MPSGEILMLLGSNDGTVYQKRPVLININDYVDNLHKKLVTKKKDIVTIDYKKFSLEKSEIQLRLLSYIIKDFSKSYYPPRSNKVLGLLDRIHKKSLNKQTLSGCLIEKTKNFITVKKER